MAQRVLFRADASHDIGSGHVTRCLTLADALHAQNVTSQFLCEDVSGHMATYIAQRGYEVTLIPAGGDGKGEIEAIAGDEPMDWLVTDHYAIDVAWESAVRPYARRIMVVDDLADRAHDADLLLDQNETEDGYSRYDGLLPPRCKRLIGARYALVAPVFAQRRGVALPVDVEVARILVYFGGADPHHLTLRVAEALRKFPAKVTVLAGRQNQDLSEIRQLCAEGTALTFQAPTEDMAALMDSNDLIIGAGGATSWERCVLGKPAIVYTVAANQVPLTRRLAALGAVLWLGEQADFSRAGLLSAVQVLTENAHLRRRMSAAAHAVTDGLGAQRVARELLRGALTLRPAQAEDAGLLFSWRNHPDTRRFFMSSGPIELRDHIEWMRTVAADPARQLLVAEAAGRPVGALRYDLHGDEAEVSIYLDPARQGEGWGPTLLLQGHDYAGTRFPGLVRLTARVLNANTASIAAFRKAGYQERGQELSIDLRRRIPKGANRA